MADAPGIRIDPVTRMDLDARVFGPATWGEGEAGADGIAPLAYDLAEWICRRLPPGRRRALALTKLEEAVLWTLAGIGEPDRPQAVVVDAVAPAAPHG